MSDLISYFQTTDNAFWGDDVYRWWFYLSIVLIIVLEKRKMVKRVYAIYPIVFFIALFNPITYEVTKFFAGGMWQYYARLYSMLPVPYTLALGTILLMDLVRGRKRRELSESGTGTQTWRRIVKFNLSIGMFVLIIFGGTSVYSQDWMQPAQNIGKVPNEALWICNELHSDKGVTIAVPDSLSSYIRQIDASFYMPYGRYVNELGYALSQEHPDPEYVMEEAGKEACDYIVIHDNEENRDRFSECGYTKYQVIGSYLAYPVEGVERIKKEYDRCHRLISETYIDEKGNLNKSERGYATIRFDYDEYGYCNLISYYDETNKLCMMPWGYASCKTEQDQNRQFLGERYYNEKGEIIGNVCEGLLTENAFQFMHFSDGVRLRDNSHIFLSTSIPNNSFNLVLFQLHDVRTGGYKTSFGRGNSEGLVCGEYTNEYSDGLYRLSLKGNTNIEDEYFYCYVYLLNGSTIKYSYIIDEFQQQSIELSDLNVEIIE